MAETVHSGDSGNRAIYEGEPKDVIAFPDAKETKAVSGPRELQKTMERLRKLELEIEKTSRNAEESCERERLLLDLINNAAVGVYRTTEEGEFLLVNRKLARIFGCPSTEEFLSSVPNVSMLYCKQEDKQMVLDQLLTKRLADVEVQARCPDGRTIWISVISRKTDRVKGAAILEGFITDITERKRAEESLLESERRFRMLVEQAGDAFFIHDYAGKIFDVNRRACETLGYSREELLGMKISDVDVEVQKKQHRPRFWERLDSGKFVTFEGLQTGKDGRKFPVEVRLGRLDLGEQKLLLSLTRDITERKRADDQLRSALQEITELKNRLEKENVHLRREIELTYRHERIVGESAAIRKVLHEVERVATEETYVLIQGETGTGKELLARAIHNMSPRKGRPMVTVNCAALPPTLIESELFGRERGAFTGAVSRQVGRFEAANGSTLFLDEVGDLPQELQSKLLRVLQDGTFERLGSSETISVDVRVIAATNQDLSELVREKKFRRDLFYRLNVFPITVPPLVDRREDIPLLVWAFVREFGQNMGKAITNIPKRIMDQLQAYSWPGNVRELRNVVERAMILSSGSTLHIEHFDGSGSRDGAKVTLNEVERAHILLTLQATGWRVSGRRGAARVLGLKESTLRSRMQKLGVKRPV